MTNGHTFNPTILREYDIRGIVGETLMKEDVYAAARRSVQLSRRMAVIPLPLVMTAV